MSLREIERLARRIDSADIRRATIVSERDRLIRAALARGASLREVANAAGLSHGTIANIRDAT